jgi:hypothetical protein
LQQRLLAYLAKRIAQKQPCDVAPSMWDFQYNFGVLSSLVVYRARLLDRQHLLLKLGAPTSGPAATAELSPTRVHFFALYDVLGTCFKGFWRGADGKLLTSVMAQPAQLLAASHDMSPWDRCCAAALYPPGFAIGFEEEEQQGQQQQQQGQHRSRRTSSSRGSRATAAAGAVVATAGQQQQQQQQQRHWHSSSLSAAAAARSAGNGAVLHAGAAAAAGSSGATASAAADTPGPAGHVSGDATAAAAAAAEAGAVVGSSSSSSSKAAKERLKLLRQVVLLVLPGLQVRACLWLPAQAKLS